jgi:Asp-tRNA(Asn)/Glu-tRNA(Gln) amidotransferase A subunit family amidase
MSDYLERMKGSLTSELWTVHGFPFLSFFAFLQVSIPAGEYKHVPVGVSLLAKHGSDRLLLDTVVALYATVQEESGMGVGPSSITRNDNGLVKEKV